ncbi:hypothetical protein [Methylorubrum suomiense]|uniref:RES domain-containing protein n=1 Tax=Methylorubrum suomiense TaxID=144191 RepID=A0ABQ4V0V9_9HYPH|nr:hypothetical protein [Methylorubrum suomiense]GJE78063.1 hypothetical protein BGCPKDLD_4674 [Methylorubrum suomiense]
MPEPLPLTSLPPRLQNKILLETGPEGDETAACWLWTGTVKRARSRFRHFVPGPDYDGARLSPGAYRNDRDTPMVRSPEYGYAVPANRVVYASANRQPVKSVPFLKRCANDLCVSPHHSLPQEGRQPRFRCVGVGKPRKAHQRPNLGIVEASGSVRPAPAVEPGPERLAPSAALQRLRAADVSPYQTPADAAREAGIHPDDVTPHVWSIYYAEAED